MANVEVVNWFDVGYQIALLVLLIGLISFIVSIVKRKKKNKSQLK